MTKHKPTVTVARRTYQPRKAELEADVSIDTSPEFLAKCIVQDVKVCEVDSQSRKKL